MALKILVEFAQEHFGALTRGTDAPGDTPPALDVEHLSPSRPSWIGQAGTRDVPFGVDHPWRIEGPIDHQQPPPNVEELGADALAFWVPFHFYRERWGIFIRASGVVYLAEVLKGSTLAPGDESYLDIAEAVLLHHERGHAEMEIGCTRIELIARTPIYQPYFAYDLAHTHEEALCNARALFWSGVGQDVQVRKRAETWMSRQGPGYRDFGLWASARKFSRGIDRAAHHMLKPLPPPSPRSSGALRNFLFHEVRRYNLPITRILDDETSQASILRPFPKDFGMRVLVHTNDHRPPHIHIQMLSKDFETRYLWPDRKPIDGDPRLPSAAEKSLEDYILKHGKGITEKIQRVYG